MKPSTVLRHALAGLLLLGLAGCQSSEPDLRFDVSFSEAVGLESPVTGRLFVIITRNSDSEPRLQAGMWEFSVPFFGVDVEALRAGEIVTIDANTVGYPPESMRDIPAGDYDVQALLQVYSRFERSDGHVLWLNADEWHGQAWNRAPGSLLSQVKRVRIDPAAGYRVRLDLTEVIPPVEVPPDTRHVRRIKIQSPLLSEFWGRPMYLGAVALLPKGYDENPDVHYPVVYSQGHFSLNPPLGYRTVEQGMPEETEAQRSRRLRYNRETSWELSRLWDGDGFPRMIVVTLQHPTPYYDDSYGVNSANNGPYADALMTELIPAVEKEFRAIGEPYARVLTGGSTGGWIALALQVHYPEFFGGSWPMYPDYVDFRHYGLVNIYEDANAFVAPGFNEWNPPERYWMRDRWLEGEAIGQPNITNREMARIERVRGSRIRSLKQLAAWEAAWGPVGEDGYPRALWDKETGEIDREVAHYMRDSGNDLTHYLKENWSEIGRHLVGKIHLSMPEMDQFYLELAAYTLEDFLESTTDPYYGGSFTYGRPKMGHGWQPAPTSELLRTMADHIARNAPPGAATSWR